MTCAAAFSKSTTLSPFDLISDPATTDIVVIVFAILIIVVVHGKWAEPRQGAGLLLILLLLFSIYYHCYHSGRAPASGCRPERPQPGARRRAHEVGRAGERAAESGVRQ